LTNKYLYIPVQELGKPLDSSGEDNGGAFFSERGKAGRIEKESSTLAWMKAMVVNAANSKLCTPVRSL